MKEIVYRGLVLVPVNPGYFAASAWETWDGVVRIEHLRQSGLYTTVFTFAGKISDVYAAATYQESLDLGIDRMQATFEAMERFFSVLS